VRCEGRIAGKGGREGGREGGEGGRYEGGVREGRQTCAARESWRLILDIYQPVSLARVGVEGWGLIFSESTQTTSEAVVWGS
jgi:hypothetical protein